MIVHHQPLGAGSIWNLHAWQLAWDGNSVWDPTGVDRSGLIEFEFPDVADPRTLQFMYRATATNSGVSTWEAQDFVRQVVNITATEIWTFAQSPRILYRPPAPPGVVFEAGAVLTFNVITKQQFAGGQVYAWNPYDAANPTAFFAESARDAVAGISTFTIPLASWMTAGFHLKLMTFGADGGQIWEPDASNRVWRPCDGTSLWLKSGQCDVRNQPLTATPVPLEILLPSAATAPALTLTDVAEDLPLPVTAAASQPYAASPLFQVVSYRATIYPEAAYTLTVNPGNGESAPIVRAFPANPADLTQISRFALGTGGWLTNFPGVANSVTLCIEPRNASSLVGGVAVQLSLGNSTPYVQIPASRAADGSWTAVLTVAQNTTTRIQLLPALGSEPKPYDGIDTGRYFTPPAVPTTVYTTEGVYGVSSRGKTPFADPLPSRAALLQAAFGTAVVDSGVLGANEMPQGATLVGTDVYFVVHAPHAVWAQLVWVDESASGPAVRREIPMTLTADARYWWCAMPASNARADTRYHFLLNDDLEVMDPAARAVQDNGSFDVAFGADPNDATTSWSKILDVAAVRASAHASPWQTMGWQNLVIYEMHAERFTNLAPGALAPLDLCVDELKAVSRLGQPGYLHALPVTALELMPVQEFSSAVSWGYDPSFYFAIDGHYGGSASLANFVNAAHQSGRAVLLDVVYNHSLGSPLMQIAPEVYANGNYDGDRMNCGHPMVLEHLRQATLHLSRTFGIDGFRFDDTQKIAQCEGGWAFLATLRSCIRAAASAEGRAWPFCIAENSATSPWDVSNPGFGVMDGQWGIDEVYRLRDASYDIWHPGSDDAPPVCQEMNNPAYWGRPYFQAVRFGESHDMVSAQDPANLRIAARPPFGDGLQLAKALGTLTLLSNGIPMLFMGQEVGETVPFAFDSSAPALNPQQYDLSPVVPAHDNARVLAWFRQLLGLRNDPNQGLQGDSNYQVVKVGNRTVAFTCGAGQCLFAIVTFGTPNLQQDSAWLGLPADGVFKEIFNSSWPAFQVSLEPPSSNGGYAARLTSGAILNLPYIGAVVLQRV